MSKILLSKKLSDEHGLLTEGEIDTIKKWAKKMPFLSTVVNIGIGPGTSLAALHEALPQAKLYGVDIKDKDFSGVPYENIQKDSKQLGRVWDDDIDLLFIDGDHYEPEEDFVFWPLHVKEDGLIMVHNYLDRDWPWVTFHATKYLSRWERVALTERIAVFRRT